MSEITLSDIDLTRNSTPYVFKNIDSSDVSISPFTIHKSWTVTSGSSTSSCLPLNAVYFDVNVLPALGSELTYNDAKNIDGSLQTITYYSINHNFYKNKRNLYSTVGSNSPNFEKYLYISASILSFPYIKVGEGIKSKSFNLQSSSGSIVYELETDKYGNIFDTQLSTSRIISNVKFYEGFNELFDPNRISYDSDLNNSFQFQDRYISGSVTFEPGVRATDGDMLPIGHAAVFNGNGMLYVPNDTILGLYDRDHNYSISFFISASNTGATSQHVISKANSRSPYHITILPNKKIRFYIFGASNQRDVDGLDETVGKSVYVTSTSAVSSSWNHVVCQKSGSYMQIYVNGSLQVSTNQPLIARSTSSMVDSMRIDCDAPTLIGSRNINSTASSYVGKLDEIRIYNKALTTTEIGYLNNLSETGSMLQTNIVGNVFDKQGIAVISSPNYIYNKILQTPYTANYKSTITRYELSTIVRINSDEFNLSLNQSLLGDNSLSYQSFVSSSEFNPYITTVGLYDDAGRLLAIGKLAHPLKKREDVNTNILIRLDLDKNIK